MSGTIYSGRYLIGSDGTYVGITLSNPATQNPATLGNYINVTSGPAILGEAGPAWGFSNQGLLIDYGMDGPAGGYGTLNNPGGVVLLSGGTVVNGNTGTLGQGQIIGDGPFYADGRIEETTVGVSIAGAPGLIENFGTILAGATGAVLAAGGTLLNGAAADTIALINAVVVAATGPALIINYGTIGHGGLLGGNGIDLQDGGTVVNRAGAYIRSGTTFTGVAGTLLNAGKMNHAVTMTAGGLLANEAGGTIMYGVALGGAATLTNAGLINRGGAVFTGASGVSFANTGTIGDGAAGVALAGAGVVTNGDGGSAGLILGAITIGGTGALVVNDGTVVASGGSGVMGSGVRLSGAGTVVNAGTIVESTGYMSGAGVALAGGGTVLNSGTLIGAPTGAGVIGGTIINAGLIGALPQGRATGAGVLVEGGLFSNTGTVATSGYKAFGAELVGATAVNAGVIRAAGTANSVSVAGLYVANGGTILNTGLISAGATNAGSSDLPAGIEITGTVGASIANFGTVSGTAGVVVARLVAAGTNGGAVDPDLGVTLVNAGVIAATGTPIAGLPGYVAAVRFGDGSNLLVVQPGASFAGLVAGGTASNTLEFATGTLTTAQGLPAYGVLTNFGTSFTNFGTLRVDAGAEWEVTGSIAAGVTLQNNGTLLANAGGTLVVSAPLTTGTGTIVAAGHGTAELLGGVAASQTARFIDLAGTLVIGSLGGFAGTIAGFAGGDAIELAGVTATTAHYANHRLTIANNGSAVGTLTLGGSFAAGDMFSAVAAGAMTVLTTTAPCLAAGTRLATPGGGMIAVEAVRPGAMLLTSSGVPAKVAWVGHRWVDCSRHPRPELVQPIRIAAGAFGPGLPARALLLSPDHAVFVDGVLIPAQLLVNGRTIVQCAQAAVEYWHVELARHDVLLAEGLPVESYLDTGNRAAFVNGADFVSLHPDFAPLAWDGACAELVRDGPILTAVRARLFARAGGEMSKPAPALRVQVGGSVLRPVIGPGGAWSFALPAATRRVDLDGPTWMPAACDPRSVDRRTLGVRLFGVMMDGVAVRLDAGCFGSGFHPVEQSAEGPCRWTAGRAWIHVPVASRRLSLLVGDEAGEETGHGALPARPPPKQSLGT